MLRHALDCVVPGPSSTSGVLRPDRELLTAWLLLFLARGSDYGYGLAQQLRAQSLDVEMTIAYRVLRALERDGQISSRWIGSSVGPRRRLYSLTATGRRTLDSLVLAVVESRDHYCDFAATFEQRRGTASPSSPPPGATAARHPGKALLTGWVLLLLDTGSSYGYDVRRHLAEHDVAADPGTVYRLLRRLDQDGWVRSRWADPVSGPRRRLYRLTARGRCGLDELALLIARICALHGEFVEAYAHIDDGYRGPAIARRGSVALP